MKQYQCMGKGIQPKVKTKQNKQHIITEKYNENGKISLNADGQGWKGKERKGKERKGK